MATRFLARSLLTTNRTFSSAIVRSYAAAPSPISNFSCRLRPLVSVAITTLRNSPVSTTVRGFATRQTTSSLNDSNPNWSNRPPKETILLDGCDFEHWLVVMEKPEGDPTRDEIIDSYVKTLAKVVGSEEEARMKLYSVSTRCYYAFGALVSEEVSYKIKELEGVRWVLPDSYLDVKNKDYGGEPVINGVPVPYDPKYHEEWIRNNARANDRNRRNDRPRNFDRSRNFERRRENMQTSGNQRGPPPNMGGPGGPPPNNMGGPGGPPPNNMGGPGGPPPNNMGGPGGPPPYNMGGPGGPPPNNMGGPGGPPPNNMGGPGGPPPNNMGGPGGPPPYNMGGPGGPPPNTGGPMGPRSNVGPPPGNNWGGQPPQYSGGPPNYGGGQPQGSPNYGGGQPNNWGQPQPNYGGGMPPNNMGNAPNYQQQRNGPSSGGIPYQGGPGPNRDNQNSYNSNVGGGNTYQTQDMPGRDVPLPPSNSNYQ